MYGFIVNAASGNGKGARIWRKIEIVLKEREIPFEVSFTEKPGHATLLAERMSKQGGFRSITAVGGDGTVNEVAAGLLGGGVPMGYIAAGSGNDFARGMKLPNDPMDALRTVLDGRTASIDIGRVGSRVFVNSFGTGFDGEVAQTNNASIWKRWMNRLRMGAVSYAIAVLTVLVAYRPAKVTVEIDGSMHGFHDTWMVVAANMPYYGGGMNICPDAAPNDGVLRICIVHGMTRMQLIQYFPRIYRGTHTSLPYVTMLSGRRMTLHSDRSLPSHVDGEAAETGGAEVILVERGLSVIVS